MANATGAAMVEDSINRTNCVGNPDPDMFHYVASLLLTIISALGFLGNAAAVYVMLKPSMRGFFSNLLTSLAAYDCLFLLVAIFTFGLPDLSESYKRDLFPTLMPYAYGLSHLCRVGSVYSTLSVTLERFFAIVLPFHHFKPMKRFLLPGTSAFAIVYNFPKFFELTSAFDHSTNETCVVGTALRESGLYNPFYIFWSKVVLIEVVPYFTIVILNSFILVKIFKSNRFRACVLSNLNKGGSLEGEGVEMEPLRRTTSASCKWKNIKRQSQQSRSGACGRAACVSDEKMRFFEKQRAEHKLSGLLVAISVLFVTCQSFKIIPDMYEVLFCSDRSLDCESTVFIDHVIGLSHLLVCINSFANCVVYLFCGEKFRRAWVQTFCPSVFCSRLLRDDLHGPVGAANNVNASSQRLGRAATQVSRMTSASQKSVSARTAHRSVDDEAAAVGNRDEAEPGRRQPLHGSRLVKKLPSPSPTAKEISPCPQQPEVEVQRPHQVAVQVNSIQPDLILVSKTENGCSPDNDKDRGEDEVLPDSMP